MIWSDALQSRPGLFSIVKPGRRPAETVALWTATLCGAGRSPFVPGTVGTLAALPLVAASGHWLPLWGYAAATAAVTVAGIWAAGVSARALGRHDPGIVVIDEAAGLFVTMTAMPVTAPTLAAGFLLFRLFDILKPPPASRAERLPGGLGIVLDDLIAGAYANLALQAAWLLYHRLPG
jgi:phosphatidylglycerophosphatase A